FETFDERFVEAARGGNFDLIVISQIFFKTGQGFNRLEELAELADPAGPWVVVDGYHGFMATPTDLSAVADRVFYVSGGYKYAMTGEGAGFLLLERDPAEDGQPWLLGYGESSDAHHMSAPHPEGEGAVQAMQAALTCAGLAPDNIDYINLHGTGTPANDRAEDRAVTRIFGGSVMASSTKGATGHTLGAAGAIEAALCLTCIEGGLLPGTQGTRVQDPELSLRVLEFSSPAAPARVLSNSFGFGGSNCSLILGRP
ncbi:MAG: aminotransferase class V-fold PLP-dependent enzyme, partial [Chromatiaceae bacterium]|nr:aminotransferase class V-fold PLP-dependent enzyme [Chromatiaceae bacterium]